MHHIMSTNEGIKKKDLSIKDPLMRPAKATYLVDGETAYVEVANSAGLQMLRVEERDPF